jgi:hypothetical protein
VTRDGAAVADAASGCPIAKDRHAADEDAFANRCRDLGAVAYAAEKAGYANYDNAGMSSGDGAAIAEAASEGSAALNEDA